MSNRLLDKLHSLIICVGSMLAVIILQIGLMALYIVAGTIIVGPEYKLSSGDSALFHILYSIVAGLLYGLIYKRMSIYNKNILYRRNAADTLYTRSTVVRVFVLIMLGIALQAAVFGVLNIVYVVMPDNGVLESYKDTISNLNGSITPLILIYTFIFGPIAEEMIYRGVIMCGALKSFSFIGANIIQALCFGIYHGNIVQGIYAFAIGIVFGIIMGRRGKIIDSIVLHITVNMSGILIVPILSRLLSGVFSEAVAYVIVCVLGIVFTVVLLKAIYVIDNTEALLNHDDGGEVCED